MKDTPTDEADRLLEEDALVEKVFSVIDKDGNGSVTPDEIYEWFQSSSLSQSVSWTRFLQQMLASDRNNDGRLSLDEFNRAILYFRERRSFKKVACSSWATVAVLLASLTLLFVIVPLLITSALVHAYDSISDRGERAMSAVTCTLVFVVNTSFVLHFVRTRFRLVSATHRCIDHAIKTTAMASEYDADLKGELTELADRKACKRLSFVSIPDWRDSVRITTGTMVDMATLWAMCYWKVLKRSGHDGDWLSAMRNPVDKNAVEAWWSDVGLKEVLAFPDFWRLAQATRCKVDLFPGLSAPRSCRTAGTIDLSQFIVVIDLMCRRAVSKPRTLLTSPSFYFMVFGSCAQALLGTIESTYMALYEGASLASDVIGHATGNALLGVFRAALSMLGSAGFVLFWVSVCFGSARHLRSLVVQYLPKTLADADKDSNGNVTLVEVKEYVAHQEGILARDIKMLNSLLDDSGLCKEPLKSASELRDFTMASVDKTSLWRFLVTDFVFWIFMLGWLAPSLWLFRALYDYQAQVRGTQEMGWSPRLAVELTTYAIYFISGTGWFMMERSLLQREVASNTQIYAHFLREAVEGHVSFGDETRVHWAAPLDIMAAAAA